MKGSRGNMGREVRERKGKKKMMQFLCNLKNKGNHEKWALDLNRVLK